MMRIRFCCGLLGVWSLAVASVLAQASVPTYYVYVVSEATDEVSLVRFRPDSAAVLSHFTTGLMPADMDGPHGVDVSPDGRHYYVSLGHGKPFGYLWKYRTEDNQPVGQVRLGLFPATLDVSPEGAFAYVVNFNLHGDMVPSSVSVVATEIMMEIARIPTCTMPHGSRFSPDGMRHYSACMMDDMLVEIDTRALQVARHFMVGADSPHGMDGPPHPRAHHGQMAAGHDGAAMQGVTCSPTWAQPSVDGQQVYVACNKSNEILEIAVSDWTLRRRIPAGNGVYNLAITPDGRRLVASNKRGASVSVIDLASGRALAELPTRRKVVHGVAVSPDSRYAFVSVEGIGDEAGTVEVLDLITLKTVAVVEVAHQAAGIDFWKME
jgi:DNA-binding beta-propeller fold protein YncE